MDLQKRKGFKMEYFGGEIFPLKSFFFRIRVFVGVDQKLDR